MDEDGYFFITDRKKDMILSGGYNIYPRELEEVFATHPDVLEVAVIGIKSEKRGEEPIAYVVRQPGATISEEALMAWGKEQLAAYKYPRKVVFINELPKSGVGKILKRELRDMVAKG
jgi:long-chain acyl-CoA synthetase